MTKEHDERSFHSLQCTRRRVLLGAGGMLLAPGLWGCATVGGRRERRGAADRIHPAGPGSRYVPRMKAAFVRREGDYGMRWPGAVYDGEAARRQYTAQLLAAASKQGIEVNLREAPIYSPQEADEWLAAAKETRPDGLLVVLLDRQMHAWPTAVKAIDTGIPTVVFAPLGAAFTTNTDDLAHRPGSYVCSTSDFSQAAYGMKMVAAGARLREMRYVVLAGDQRRDASIPHLGTNLRYVPASTFLEAYRQTPTSDEIRRIARAYLREATSVRGATFDDVCNGVKSYEVARSILVREEGDAITMDCLGALGKSEVSLPCIAWSRMLDDGIPAACEADLGACVTHAMVQFLFDRPGFQQDPVAETARECLIGAHCSCPTRLNGIAERPEPFRLSYHHGKRDAVPVTQWKIGQPITVADVLLDGKGEARPELLVSTGKVVENVSVPPAGGCVVSVMVELDGITETLDYPGFHQLFFYGHYRRELAAFAQLHGMRCRVI